MLIFDFRAIGSRLLAVRRHCGMTQLEVAVAAELSERAYADIERGTVNMRMETFLRICNVLHVTPDEILTETDTALSAAQEELWQKLLSRPPKDRETALRLLSVYLNSLDEKQ